MMRQVPDGLGVMDDTVNWLSAEEQCAWRAFIRLHQKLFSELVSDLQSHSRLSGTDFEVLVALTDLPDGRLRFQDLAREIEWEQSRLSHQIRRMIKRDLVAPDDCAEDGRRIFRRGPRCDCRFRASIGRASAGSLRGRSPGTC
jgi:hypothetical protein